MDQPIGFPSRVTLSRPRSLKSLSTLGASQILRRLRDWGLPKLHPAGSQGPTSSPGTC